MKRTLRLAGMAVLFCLHPLTARAACVNPNGVESQIVYNQDYHTPQYCNGTDWIPFAGIDPAAGGGTCSNPVRDEGVIIYNTDHHVLQYCDGTNWIGVGAGGGGLTGPSGCANIGDLCADGTVFAGYHPITREYLFIPTTDQGTTSKWKTSTGTDDIATDSTWDGRANSNQVANSTTFPTFKLCKDLGDGGHSDWYLPSRVEAYYLWSVHETIQAGGHITNFLDVYWTSTEDDTDIAWFQNFVAGNQGGATKTLFYRVRCVRR